MKMCGEGHPDVAYALDHLAVCVRGEGRLAEAEILERQALAIRRKAIREEDPFVAITLNSLAEILRDQGKLAEAENMFREAWTIRSKTLGTNIPLPSSLSRT